MTSSSLVTRTVPGRVDASGLPATAAGTVTNDTSGSLWVVGAPRSRPTSEGSSP
jgi:hypothetical protein